MRRQTSRLVRRTPADERSMTIVVFANGQSEHRPSVMADYPLIWRVRTRLPDRYRHRCRVVARSRRMNSALVEFADGYRVVTSRNYVRRAGRLASARSTG